MSRRPGAYAIARRGGTVLLIHDAEDDRWYLPGGGIEEGETPEEALAREVTEETGFRLLSADPLFGADEPSDEGVIKECHFFLVEVDDTDPSWAEHEIEWVLRAEAVERLAEEASRRALALATPSLVTTTVPDLSDPVVPGGEAEHRQAVAEAGLFHLVEIGGRATSTAGDSLRFVAANVERGRHLDAWAELLASTGGDVFLLSELDGGMARSKNRYVARELADRLGAEFAFAVEFVELSLGNEQEREALPADSDNEFGVHGGAILSRVPLDRPAAVRLEFDGDWYGDESTEPRIGGRLAVLATVGDLVVVAPHLESHGGPDGRARQIADLLGLVETYAEGRPVVIGGDLNTHTLDLRGGGEQRDGALVPERFRDPVAYEPLFEEAAARGYEWEPANDPEPTHRTVAGQGDLKLDWFITRGAEVSDAEIIPAVDRDGEPISDHDVIAVTVRLS